MNGKQPTGWSKAGVLGPVLVNSIRKFQIDAGVPRAEAYSITMYSMAGLLLVGFISNRLMKEVDGKHHYQAAD